MTEKELKKLNRYQLLELLVLQTERADQLQQKVEELEARLETRELNFSRLGSLAEAAVQISGLLEASEQAALLYMNSAKKQADNLVAAARNEAEMILLRAKENGSSTEYENRESDIQNEE